MRISGRPGRRRPNIAISDRTIEYTYIGTTCCDTRPPATTITPPPSGAKNPPARQDDRIYVYQDAPAEDVPILLYQNARQNEPARPPPVGALFSLSNFLIQRQRRCFLTKGVLHARARAGVVPISVEPYSRVHHDISIFGSSQYLWSHIRGCTMISAYSVGASGTILTYLTVVHRPTWRRLREQRGCATTLRPEPPATTIN